MKKNIPVIPPHKLRHTVHHLNTGGVIAYPTEGVFGLGCDPDNIDAIKSILQIKNRPANKGLILIAADIEMLTPYIDTTELADVDRVLSTWPGPTTWLINAGEKATRWLRGQHETIAVRVTAHPVASQLSKAYGKPLVSTSANTGGFSPARSTLKTRQYFAREKILIVAGMIGQEDGATSIFDARTTTQFR